MGFWDTFWGTEELLKKDIQTARKNASFLKRIPPQKIHSLKTYIEGKIFVPAFFGYYVRVGEFLNTYVGRIVIIQASYQGVIFTVVDSIAKNLIGKTYFQEADSFRGDMKTYPFYEAGKRARPIKKLAEIELNLILGIASAASGFVLAAVMITSITQFVVENEKEFPKWIKLLKVLLIVDTTLKKHAPILHKKTRRFILKGILKGVTIGAVPTSRNLPKAYYKKNIDAEHLAKLLGSIIGTIGKKEFTKRVSLGAVFWVIVQKAILDVLKAFPEAIKITIKQKKRLAQNLIQQFRKAGVKITETEAMQIIQEIRKKPKVIRKSIRQLQIILRNI